MTWTSVKAQRPKWGAETSGGDRAPSPPALTGQATRAIRVQAAARVLRPLPLTGLGNEPIALAQLEMRRRDAFPKKGGSGRPKGPTPRAARNGVIARGLRSRGLLRGEITAFFRARGEACDDKQLRRWEHGLQELEAREGNNTAPTQPDPQALQAAAYTSRGFEATSSAFGKIVKRVAVEAAFMADDAASADEIATEALVWDPDFWELAAELRFLAAERDEDLQIATGFPPIITTGDPQENRQLAYRYLQRRDHLQLVRLASQLRLTREAMLALPLDRPDKSLAMLRLFGASQREEQRDTWRRRETPGSSRRQ